MRLVGAIPAGETPSDNEAADGLAVLNDMVDSWNVERLMIFTETIAEFPLIPGQQVYTYGTGGNFNAARPARIDRASIVSLANPIQPLELKIDYLTDRDWQEDYPVKNITTTLPLAVYDDGAFPFRNLSYWPIPTVAVNTRLYSWTALRQFPDLCTDITFPPGYAKALRYNLAVDIAAEFPGNPAVMPLVNATADETKGLLKSLNLPIVQTTSDPALIGEGGRYNFYDDRTVGEH